MANYANLMARDTGGEPVQTCPPPFVANARYNSQNGVASSVVSLHPNTSEIEIGAFGGQGAVMKWIPITDLTQASVISSGIGIANYDHWIPAGVVRRFVVPKETQGSYAGQVGSINGLYQRVALMNGGTTASSVIVAEY